MSDHTATGSAQIPVTETPLGRLKDLMYFVSTLIPAIMILDPILIWPLLYAIPDPVVFTAKVELAPPPNDLLHKLWFPPLFALAVFSALVSGLKRPDLKIPQMRWFFIFLAWSGLSIAWAIVPSASISRLFLQILIFTTLYLSFVVVRDPKRILEPLFWVLVATAAVNLLEVVSRPPGPIGHEGIYDQKNMLGAVATMTIMICVFRLTWGHNLGRLVALGTIPVCLFLLYASESKTSAGLLPLSIMIGILCIAMVRGLKLAGIIAFLSVIIVFCLTILMTEATIGFGFIDLAWALTGDPTFTGRTALWDFAWDYVPAKPWLGYGFRSFWDVGLETPSLVLGRGFIASSPTGHNGYLDIVLGGGVIALLIFLPILVAGFNRAGHIGRQWRMEGVMMMAFMSFFALYNLLETAYFLGSHVVFMLFQIIWMTLLWRADQLKQTSVAQAGQWVRIINRS